MLNAAGCQASSEQHDEAPLPGCFKVMTKPRRIDSGASGRDCGTNGTLGNAPSETESRA